jgi:hypothetical protein
MYTFSRNKLSNTSSLWSRLSLLTTFFISSCVAYIFGVLFAIVMQFTDKYSLLAEEISFLLPPPPNYLFPLSFFPFFFLFKSSIFFYNHHIFLTVLTVTAMLVFMRYGYLTHKKLDRVPLFPPHRKTKRLNKVKIQLY